MLNNVKPSLRWPDQLLDHQVWLCEKGKLLREPRDLEQGIPLHCYWRLYLSVIIYGFYLLFFVIACSNGCFLCMLKLIICKLMAYDICNSSGTFISASDDTTGILDTIEEKIAQVTMLPRQNGEVILFSMKNRIWTMFNLFRMLLMEYVNWFAFTILQTFNILRYEVGQRYVPHYDAFNPAQYGPQPTQRVYLLPLYRSINFTIIWGFSFHQILLQIISFKKHIYTQVASFLLYLTNVEEGGETMFPYEVCILHHPSDMYIYIRHYITAWEGRG